MAICIDSRSHFTQGLQMPNDTIKWHNVPQSVLSRHITVYDLSVHIFEAFPSSINKLTDAKYPLVILLHGFPELAYSWRKILQPLADAGYHVVAPDLRGYGQTVSLPLSQEQPVSTTAPFPTQSTPFSAPLAPWHMSGAVADITGLVHALGYTSTRAVIGHDFGSRVAAHCALLRPDVFPALVMMSAPFPGIAPLDLPAPDGLTFTQRIALYLASLSPPRIHYTHYYSTPLANQDMHLPLPKLHQFLRGYYHVKSGAWAGNSANPPRPVESEQISVLPNYYIMPKDANMVEAVKQMTNDEPSDITHEWLTDDELGVYATHYALTGFQGGLNAYRCLTEYPTADDPSSIHTSPTATLRAYVGRTIDLPCMFIAGERDWGTWQYPGATEKMRQICGLKSKDGDGFRMRGDNFVIVPGAGHWVQQEASNSVTSHLIRFLGALAEK